MKLLESDYLVLGSGAAGLCATATTAERGHDLDADYSTARHADCAYSLSTKIGRLTSHRSSSDVHRLAYTGGCRQASGLMRREEGKPILYELLAASATS